MSKHHGRRQRILLIEDDRKVASFVRRGLEEEGYDVQWSRTGSEGLESAGSFHPELTLLDLRLPDIFGIDVCRQLRRKFPSLPILMLTALDAVPDRVAGLEAGADDYLPKPFAFEELLARVRALLRRAQLGPDDHVFSDGDLRLDVAKRDCSYRDRLVPLSPTEFDLLAYFMSRSGQAVHRDEVLDAVWGRDGTAIPNVVDVYVGYVRKKLRSAGAVEMIKAVRGVGYRYVPDTSESK